MPSPLRLDGIALGLLIVLSMLWGGSFVWNAVILAELPVMTLVALRLLLASLALWVFLLVRGVQVPRALGVWLAFFFMGLVNNAIPFSLIVWGQTEISAGLAAIFNATTPIFTAVIAGAVLVDERLSARRLAGLAFALAGIVVLVGPAALGGVGSAVLAQLAVLSAAISYGVAAVFARRFARWGVSPLSVAAGQLTASSAVMVPLALALDGLPAAMPSGRVVLAVVGLAFLATALAYVLYFSIVARAGATNAALVTVLVPISATGFGVAFLGETVGFSELSGMAFILFGIAVLDGRLLARLPRRS